MRQKIIRLISAVLIMTLTINMAQLEIFADTFTQNNVYDLSDGYTDEEIAAELDTRLPEDGKPAVVIEELDEKRDKYTKYFLNDDFSFTAAQYNDPVHYQTDDGSWAEIDNSLVKTENEDGETVYENKASDIKVQFGADSHAEELVSIDNGDFEISWGINNKKSKGLRLFSASDEIRKSGFKVAELENNVATAEKTLTEAQAFRAQAAEEDIEEYNSDRMTVENAASAGEYENILPDVDLKYELKGETVKENIVLNSVGAADTDISFRINHANLDMQASADGSITLISRESGEEVYRLDAPFMYDAAGETSSAVEMQITAVTSDESILTVVADKTWLKDTSRVYPVVIDPITETAQTYTGIEDINVRENRNEPYDVSSRNLWVGRASNGDEFRSFVNFKELPDIGKGSQVTGAMFVIYSYGDPNETADNKIFSVHKVAQEWTSTGLTWATQPYFLEAALDYTTYHKQPAYQGRSYGIDITQAARDWYNGYNDGIPKASGLAIKAYNPGNNEIMVFASSDVSSAEAAVRPQLHISYRNHAGLEDYWTYHSVSAGNSGTSYINDFTGNLVYQTRSIDIGDAVMPFSLYLTYNGSDANTPATTHPTQRNRFGYGFRLNVVQRVDATGISDYPYSYTDGDGTKHYFGTDMKDEDGLGLTLTVEPDNKYKIVNKEETSTMNFDEQGYLRKITDNNGNWISYNYGPENGDHILRDINTNTGAWVYLGYYGAGNNEKLKTIQDSAGRVTTFTYDQERLSTITFPDGVLIRLYYYSDGQLSKIVNNDTSGLEFQYYTDKVARVTENGFGYDLSRKVYDVAYSLYQTEFSDEISRVDTYQFNSLGLTTAAYKQDGVSIIDYSTQRASRNKVSASAGTSWAGSAINYLKNSDFSRNGKSDWIEMGSAEITGGALISGNVAKFTSTSTTTNNELWQTLGSSTIPQHTTYTLSAYVRTTDVAGVGARMHAVMRDDITDEPRVVYSEGINGTTNRDIDDGWQRLTLTFNMEQGEHFDRIGIGLCDATGTAEICNVQLEVGEVANPYNIILNGNFNIYDANNYRGTVPYGWNDPGPGYGSDELLQNIYFDTTGVNFKGDPTKSKSIMCGVPVSGSEGDVYYFSGGLYGDAIIEGSRDVRISAAVIYIDGTVRWIDAKPNQNVADLQRFSAIINTDDNNPSTNLTYSAIHVYLWSVNQINDISFGGIELVKDFGGSYTYDDEGNQVSAIDKAEQESSFAYDDNNTISKILNPDGTSYEYAKDDKKNVVTAFSSDGLSMDLTYDSFGNATSSKTQGISYVGAVIPGQKYYIRNKYSGKCLDLNGDRLVQNSYGAGYAPQQWEVVDAGGGYYALKSVYNGKAIDVPGATNQPSELHVFDYNNSSAQRFKLEVDRYGWYRISPECAPNMGLTNFGTSTAGDNTMWVVGYGNAQDQDWAFEPVDAPSGATPENGGVYLIRSLASNKVLDVNNAGTSDNSQVIQQFHATGKNQQFMLRDAGDGYFKISPMHAPDKMLDFYGPSSYDANLHALVINSDSGADTQKWKFESVGGGYYKIKNKAFGTCIDLPHGQVDTGITPIEYPDSGTDQQKWKLEKVSGDISSSANYDGTTGKLLSVTDERGNTTQYDYQSYRGTLNSTTAPDGTVTSYTYNDYNDALTSVSAAGSTVNYHYDNTNKLTGITHNGFSYGFEYDGWGNVTKTTAAGATLSENTYDISRNLLTNVTYGNGDTVEYVYDEYFDLINEKKVDGATKFKYYYDNNQNLARLVDLENNITTNYTYDLIGRISGMTISDGLRLSLKYDDKNRVEKYVWQIGDKSYTTNYFYGKTPDGAIAKPGLIYGLSINNSLNLDYTYDSLGRRAQRTLGSYVQNYGYLPGAADNSTTTLVNRLDSSVGHDYTYTYDNLGNISSISEDGNIVAAYQYDSLSQLVREDDYLRGISTAYSYDAGGNITSKVVSKLENGQATDTIETISYSYDGTWKDKLVSYNGEAITYDAIGNPLQYRGGLSFEWDNGRQLASVTKGGAALAQYSYNDEGIRVSKTVNGVTTKYYLNGSTILRQDDGTNVIDFLYDDAGSPLGFVLNGAYYYYMLNTQGDIVGILDSSYNIVAQYRYDAWGKLLSVTDGSGVDVSSNASHVGNINPLRYRGYYYDSETGFYYLNSRYYDPETDRFINADAEIAGAGGELKGYNLFSYCMNNPVNMTDDSGNWPQWLGKAIAVVAVAAVVVAAVAVTVVTFGATSVAGVAVITAAATIAARATEVAVLQVKKSTSDVKTPSGGNSGSDVGKSTGSSGKNSSGGSSSGKKSSGEVVGDVFEALYDNGPKIIGITPWTKSGSIGGRYVLDRQVAKIFGEKVTLKSTLSSVGGKVIPYAFVAYAWGQTTISIFSDDPVQRAEDRGYKLK